MRRKSSTLLTLTRTPGNCGECRHANQGTVDFGEGKLFCAVRYRTKRREQPCDEQMPLPRRAFQPIAEFTLYHLFERYDGTNCTYDRLQDTRMLAEDADAELREQLQADRPFIPSD